MCLVYVLQPVFFSTRAYVSFIKPDQTMWYRACKTCNKKVTEAMDSGYWCEGCQNRDQECSLRYDDSEIRKKKKLELVCCVPL